MKLVQALKQKNRLAGELARYQRIFERENSRRSDSVSKVTRSDIYAKILRVSSELGELKGKIATANVGIYTKLERMAEFKAHIAFLMGLSKREGEEITFVESYDKKLIYTWESHITEEDCDGFVSDIQKKIEVLQDEVDAYNATTEI